MARIDNIPRNFDPSAAEERLYQLWEDKGYFTARPDTDLKPYTIMMPPPNVTGQLHMGHALNNTLQDILIRWRRMTGDNVHWQAGTDHAAIATEARIVSALAEEGITKEALGREGFLERAWEWTEYYNSRITSQLKRLGTSCDWSRLRFTMDEGLNQAVTEVFNRLYEEGLIYRGERMINWCPSCMTTLSDIEVVHEDQDSKLWNIRYPLDGGSAHLTIATTRPETMLADVAVAVHPDDERYRDLIGKHVLLPLTDRTIPIITDDYVDMEFGTGALKITPAHDPNDFEIGERHGLPSIDMLNDDATVAEGFGRYSGLSREEARKQVVSDLREGDYLLSEEPHSHSVGTCQRCGTSIEPRISLQWFVAMDTLAGPALDVVQDGAVKFVPGRFAKSYINWVENTRDWCISRQLWWGHRIPAWHCSDCHEFTVSRTVPDSCSSCGSSDIEQDPDTLDTWFSSALWPFSTLGWPNEDDPFLKTFYPTDVLVTGYDIIGFWVARMIEQGLHLTGKAPFHTVFINGIVRDDQGRKMSKSLGNGIDPLEIIDEAGADSLRYALLTGTTAGNDQRFQQDIVDNGRGFINKVWNAFRFVMMNWDESLTGTLQADKLELKPESLSDEDNWILSRLAKAVSEVEKNLERYELGLALERMYGFIWNEFCDWYLEMVKPRLFDKDGDAEKRQATLSVLHYVLSASLRMLHPFMPFFTEELYQLLPVHGETIMFAEWPAADDELAARKNDAQDLKYERLIEAVRGIRQIRLTYNVKPQARVSLRVVSDQSEVRDMFLQSGAWLERLAGVAEVIAAPDKEDVGSSDAQLAFPGGEAYIPLADLVDLDQERARLESELSELEGILEKAEKMLANENFTGKAPEQVVEKERRRVTDTRQQIDTVKERIETLASID